MSIRRICRSFAAAMLAVLTAAPALHASPVENEIGLTPSSVFILGTKHLSGIKGEYELSILDGLIGRLEVLNPDLIAIEALDGLSVAAMAQRPDAHGETLNIYGRFQLKFAQKAQFATGKDFATAYADIQRNSPDCSSAGDFNPCILTYLAAYDYYSALLQWHKASPENRENFGKEFGDIDEAFAQRMTSTNEYITIAIRLAKALGHHRLYPVDDHSSGAPFDSANKDNPNMADEMMSIWGDIEGDPYLAEMKSRFSEAADAGDVLPYYRWVNSPETGQRDIDFQWTPLIQKDVKSRVGTSRVAAWEMRNLLMAAHISAVLVENPGKKLIYIVGSAHKPYLDGYFANTNWVEVVDSAEVLGE